MKQTSKPPGSRRVRLFRDVTQSIGRRPHQRACPLPLACLAIALPFLAAWATAAPAAPGDPQDGGGAEQAVELPNPLGSGQEATLNPWASLERAHRQPPESGAYVDLYGPLEPWEERLLVRQGYVSAGR